MKKKTKILYYIVAALVVVMLVTMTICGHVLSRYTSTAGYTSNQITVDDFYFTVDLLGDSVDAASSTKKINVHGGTNKQSIDFKVCNYFDSLRVTGSQIDYTITYESSLSSNGTSIEIKNITDTNNVTTVCDSSNKTSATQTISSSSASSITYSLCLGTYSSAETITVTIKSTSPFTKTLTLVFNLIADSTNVNCYLVNNVSTSAYVELIMTTDVVITSGNIAIDWSGATELQIDSTNSFFSISTTYTATNSVDIKAEESVSVKFFKTTSGTTYTVSSCSLTGTSGSYALAITIAPQASG